MTKYLYVLSIGPVQDFIAAARRTRDLWFGSHLLSEISKTAARTISEAGGELIFPALEGGNDRLKSSEKLDAFNVANIILAELPEGIKPSELNEKTKKAAREEWKRYSLEAKNRAGSAINEDIWADQIDDVIEFYAAWVPMGDNYQEDRARVMRLLAGRKSVRDFKPAKGRAGIPKSSLDGARESVLRRDRPIPKWLSLRMRLNEGEQLCAVGLTKRLGGEKVAFPSVVRVALDPWIRGVRRNHSDEIDRLFDEIIDLCKGENSFSSGTGDRLYQDFRFDGQIFYPSRLARAKENLKDVSSDLDEANPYRNDTNKLEQIEKKVLNLQSRDNGGLGFGEPNPYLAIIVADGDRMGKAISIICSKEKRPKEKHQEFSGQLAKFATDARRIVEENHRGCMVYSGGDDVLAFLPVDKCLEAARDLHDTFENLLKAYPDEKGKTPTLSVGIAIGHFMEPLEDLLGFGRAAEKSAKEPDRNGLAIHLHTRSGGDPIKIREQWKPVGQNGLDERFQEWVRMYLEEKFSDKTAYDIRQLAEDYRGWVGVSQSLLIKDVMRLLGRKKTGREGSKIGTDDIEKLMKDVNSHKDLCRRAEELVLARSIVEVKKLTGEPIRTEVVS
jgi:CRISPR-associated protein Cmr2